MKKTYFLISFIIIVLVFSASTVFACIYHTYQQCNGNYLYWYDSCGNQQDLIQYCQNGCYNNYCQYNDYGNYNYGYNYNYNYGYGSNCTYHAYRLCVGNSVYWYSGCDQQQDLYYTCPAGQVCNNPLQYGQCAISYIQPAPNPNPNYSPYVAHYRTACYANSLYWYDSLGISTGIYKNCADSNSCTVDNCSDNKCVNTLKCDGPACAVNSSDYKTYCATTPADNKCGNELCEANLGETSVSCPSDCKIDNVNALSVSIFSKQDSASSQWLKASQVGPNSQIFFMISVTNNSTSQVDNVSVSANIPAEVSSLGNLKLNGEQVSGDIASGVNIGSLPPASTRLLTLEGKTQTISATSTKQAVAMISGSAQSDSVSITFNPSQEAASVSSAPAAFSLSSFLKRWYMWIIAGLVVVILFFVVFKRLSSND